MRKVLTVSLIALAAVSTANAQIASKAYVDAQIGNLPAGYDNVISYVGSVSGDIDALGLLAQKDVVATADITDAAVTKAKLGAEVQASLDKADSALQKASIASGSANGTIAVDGDDVAVKGLGSAAYTNSSAYASAAQGQTADDTAALVGTLPTGATATTVVGYIAEAVANADGQTAAQVQTAINNKVESLNYAGNTDGGVVTNVTESNGIVSAVKSKVTTTEIADDAGIVKTQLAQGVQTSLDKADSALQKASIASGSANGTIAVGGDDVAVNGLAAMAYKADVASTDIVDGTIVNADISDTADIAQSKIAGLTTSLTAARNQIPSGSENNVAASANLWVE